MKKNFILLILFGITFYSILGADALFYINVSKSLPRGLYMKIPSKNLEVGDYVVYEPPPTVKNIVEKNHWNDGDVRYFSKKVGAVGGDTYEIKSNGDFFVNGKFYAKTLEEDGMGNKLPKLRGKFKVPDGYFLPLGIAEKSFDGRYTGVIAESRVKSRVIPIWTE